MEVSGSDCAGMNVSHLGEIVNNPKHIKIKLLDMKSNEK